MLRRLDKLSGLIIAASLAAGAWLTTNVQAGEHTIGRAIFEHNCIACHGHDGSGSMRGVPDLNGANSPLNKPESELVRNTIEGIPGGMFPMPPRGGNQNLTDKDIVDVVRYMKAAFSRKTDGS